MKSAIVIGKSGIYEKHHEFRIPMPNIFRRKMHLNHCRVQTTTEKLTLHETIS